MKISADYPLFATTPQAQHWTAWTIIRRLDGQVVVSCRPTIAEWTAAELEANPRLADAVRPVHYAVGSLASVLDALKARRVSPPHSVHNHDVAKLQGLPEVTR